MIRGFLICLSSSITFIIFIFFSTYVGALSRFAFIFVGNDDEDHDDNGDACS